MPLIFCNFWNIDKYIFPGFVLEVWRSCNDQLNDLYIIKEIQSNIVQFKLIMNGMYKVQFFLTFDGRIIPSSTYVRPYWANLKTRDRRIRSEI